MVARETRRHYNTGHTQRRHREIPEPVAEIVRTACMHDSPTGGQNAVGKTRANIGETELSGAATHERVVREGLEPPTKGL